VKGIELGLSGSLTDEWTVFAGYAYMDSRINESKVPAEIDRELPYVPRHSANIWTSYEFGERFTVGAGVQYTGGYFFNNANTAANPNLVEIGKMTKYWLFNAMASYEVNDHLNLQLNLNNLADKKYVERGYPGQFTPGPARSVLLSADIKFW